MPQPGYTGAVPHPGYTGAAPQPGYTGTVPQPGYTGAAPQPGYTGAMPQPGYTGAVPQAGFTGTGPAQYTSFGVSGANPAYSGAQPPLGYTVSGVIPPQPSGAFQPQNAPEQPPPGFGYVPSGNGRRGSLRWWHLLIIGAAAAAFALFVVFTLFTPASCRPRPTTATIRMASMGDSFTGDALFVRNEAAYDAEGVTSVEYIAAEGQTVYYNFDICKIFAAGYSTKEVNTLQDYRDQLRDRQMDLLTGETTIEGRRYTLDSNLLQAVLQTRESIGGAIGSLTNQEQALNRALSERQNYIADTYGADQRWTTFNNNVTAQELKIASYTKQQKALEEGIVSFYSDGYEYGLNMNPYTDFEPVQVRRMIDGEKPGDSSSLKGRTTIYRLIKDDGWVIMMLADDKSWHPADGQTYDMVITSANQKDTIRVSVESSRLSGSELLVCLRSDAPVSDVLYLRTGRVEVRDDSLAMVVPRSAIYVQDELQGVVAEINGTPMFVPVTIVRQVGDQVYISPLTQNVLREGMTVRLF